MLTENDKIKFSGESIFWEDAKKTSSQILYSYPSSSWKLKVSNVEANWEVHINFFWKFFTLVPCNETRRGSFQNTYISSFGNLVGSSKISAPMDQQEKWTVQRFCRKGLWQLLTDVLHVHISQKIVVFQVFNSCKSAWNYTKSMNLLARFLNSLVNEKGFCWTDFYDIFFSIMCDPFLLWWIEWLIQSKQTKNARLNAV